MKRILTLDTLVTLDACLEQRAKFLRIFGDQVEVSVERFSQPDVIQAGFDFGWASDLLFSYGDRELYLDELHKRRQALKVEHSVPYYHQLPKDLRIGVAPPIWAEVYVKSTYVPTIEEPRVEGTVSETPVEETLGGY